MLKRVWGVGAVALALVAGCGGVPDRAGGHAAQAVTVLRVGQTNAGGPFDQLLLWADEVARLSDGAIKIEFETAWRGDPTHERLLLKDLHEGRYDLASVAAPTLDRLGYRAFQALSAPLLMDSYELQEAVFDHGIADEMLTGLQRIDLEGVAVLPGTLHRLAGTRFGPTSARAFAGKVIGAVDSQVAESTVRALGGTFVGLYSSADVSELDALAYPSMAISGEGYQKRFRRLAGNIVLWARPLAIVMDKKRASALDDDQRDLLALAAHNVRSRALQAVRDDEQQSLRVLCGAGVVVDYSPKSELGGLRSAVQPVYEEIARDPQSRSWLDKIEALKVEVAAATSAIACPRASPTPATAQGGIPEVTYERSFTREELRRSPLYQEWWPAGTMTLTFKDGVMTMVGADGGVQTHSYTVFRGRITADHASGPLDFTATYRVQGDKLYLTDFVWPDCTDCATDELAYGTAGSKPWVKVR